MTTVSTPLTPAPHSAATAALAEATTLVAPALEAAVDRLNPELRPAVRHHMAGAGKRVRSALVLLSAVGSGGTEALSLPGAVAIELVHNFSLIHDDIIDGDRDRRHRPTVWAQFGIGPAIIAGDALAALSTQVLLDDPTPARVRAVTALVTATQEMIAGQAYDMAFETRSSVTEEQCLAMAAGKTGALLSCAASLGAILAEAPEVTIESLADFGHHVGIAFQAIDDVLGIWGDPTQTGKPAGNDLIQHKKSLPVVCALARAGDRRTEIEAVLATDGPAFDVIRAVGLLEECGARDAVMALAESRMEAALGALDRADLLAGPRSQLEAIARYVTERDR